MGDREALPPYRYGIDPGPHPTRHPEGHSFGEPGPAADFAAACARGLRLYAHGYFWEAHEAWEEPWRMLPLTDPRREFLQGLIQLTAAEWKRARGAGDAAAGLAAKALARLRRGVTGGGDVACGVDGPALVTALDVLPWDTTREAVTIPRRVTPA